MANSKLTLATCENHYHFPLKITVNNKFYHNYVSTEARRTNTTADVVSTKIIAEALNFFFPNNPFKIQLLGPTMISME